MTFDDDVRLERPVGALTVACSIGKHRLCSGSGTELLPSGSGARHVPCVCPCHGSNSDKDPVAEGEDDA